MKIIERGLFILLLASIPIQLGKHFWPDFSFVQGIRVDYLSPTLYISDIIIVLLFIISFWNLRKRLLLFISRPLFAATVVIILLGLIYAYQIGAVIFGFLKFIEFSYLAFYIAHTYTKKDKSTILFTLVLGGLVSTSILLMQFLNQASIGELFYFLGERTFSVSTIGIATFHLGTAQVLRPYGTFPHPNVAGFYLLCCFTFLLHSLKFKWKALELLKFAAITILALGIAITFSRVILLLVVVVSVWFGLRTQLKKRSKRIAFIGLILPLILVMIALFFQRLQFDVYRDIQLRTQLIAIAFQIWMEKPLFGVGLNNFFYHEILFQKTITPTLLQPVHNIYILWICQTGIAGLIILFLFVRKLVKKIPWPALPLLISTIVVGFFDHYLLTLQQGQLLLAIILGMSFARKKI